MRAALTTALLLAGLGSAAAAPDDPSGTWLTEDGRAKIRIDRCGPDGARVCGRVVWLKVPNNDAGAPRTDVKNPDPRKRSRPVLGLQIIEGRAEDAKSSAKFSGKFSGEIYNADEGKVYQVSLERESAGELSVSGCLLRVLCGSQTWTRVPDVNQQAAVTASPAPAVKPASAARVPAPGAAPAAEADE